MKTFPHYRQLDRMDCGPSCLRMIAGYYGRNYSVQYLRERCFITREGVSMLGISDATESIGMSTKGVRITLEQLMNDALLPCILHWNQKHFVTLYEIKSKGGSRQFKISDPASEKYTLDEKAFRKCRLTAKQDGEDVGTALLLEPSPNFYDRNDDREKNENSII
jgi:ATP-binding cassette subfamily B protein